MSNGKLGMKAGRPSAAKSGTTLSDLAEKSETVRVNFDLDKEQHRKLKIYSAKTGRSITEILRELVAGVTKDEKEGV